MSSSGKFLPIKNVLPAPSAGRLQKPIGLPAHPSNSLPKKIVKFSVSQGHIQNKKLI